MILDAKSFDCLSRGQKYLDRNARHWLAETDTGITFKDNFMELLMLEATGNWYQLAAPGKEEKLADKDSGTSLI